MSELLNKMDDTTGVVKEIYTDVAQPVLKPIGEILSMFPRTLKAFLSGWDKWLINREECLKVAAKTIESKLSTIEESKICDPEPYVAVPAIQQLCICQNSDELREMYANLLATSMNTDEKYKVHPAFIEIIKQLNPDEAKLLRSLRGSGVFPLIDIRLQSPLKGGGYNDIRNNITSQGYDVVENKGQIGSYIVNLCRLGLITIEDSHLINDRLYDSTIKIIEDTMKIPEVTNDGWRRVYNKHIFQLTDFGKIFVDVVI